MEEWAVSTDQASARPLFLVQLILLQLEQEERHKLSLQALTQMEMQEVQVLFQVQELAQ